MTTTSRIQAIGERANALRRKGWCTAEDVKWWAEYVRRGASEQAEVERLFFEAERSLEYVVPAEPSRPEGYRHE